MSRNNLGNTDDVDYILNVNHNMSKEYRDKIHMFDNNHSNNNHDLMS